VAYVYGLIHALHRNYLHQLLLVPSVYICHFA